MKYIAILPHRSEYPDPITFTQGATLSVGEKYDGPEAWDNWFFCTLPGHAGGWVPEQVIARTGNGHGVAREDYTARELDVDTDDVLEGIRTLNGWQWCHRPADGKSGWVPMENLRVADSR